MSATAAAVTGNDAQVERRQRLHELLLALIARQEVLELMDAEAPSALTGSASAGGPAEAARWLGRNRRVLHNYQSLVRTAVTLDALLDAEQVLPSREI